MDCVRDKTLRDVLELRIESLCNPYVVVILDPAVYRNAAGGSHGCEVGNHLFYM